MIKAESITIKYGEFVAVDQLSFHVEQGEICGFLGPNGAGKTSTIRALTGFLTPDEGSVLINGFDMKSDPINAKGSIGYMPESSPLYTDLRVCEILKFVAGIKGVKKSEIEYHIDKVLELTNISDKKEALIHTLSKGYKQRVAFSLALINDPEILILDEPTIGLDPLQISDVRTLIKDLATNHTVIFSSHILSEVQAICSKIVIIGDGKALAVEKSDELVKKFGVNKEIRIKIDAPFEEAKSKLEMIEQIRSVSLESQSPSEIAISVTLTDDDKSAARKKISRCVVDNNWDLIEMRTDPVSLEDVYLSIVTSEQS